MAKAKKKVEEIVPLPVLQGTGEQKMHQLYDAWYGCSKCLLSDTRPSGDIVFADGNPNARVMLIGEGPGEEEERTGIPFMGPSGQLLNQMLALISDDLGIQELSAWYDKAPRTKDNVRTFHDRVYEWRKNEFFITNIVCCRPPENRQPSNPEAKACFERLRMMIYTVDPMVIVTIGKTALETLLRHQAEITQKRGQLHEIDISGRIGKVRFPVMPILHPSYLLRKADWKVKDGDYAKTLKDLYKALRLKDELMLRFFGTPIPQRVEPR